MGGVDPKLQIRGVPRGEMKLVAKAAAGFIDKSEPKELKLDVGDYVSLVKSGKLTGCIYRVAHWYHSHIPGSAPWVELCIDPKHRLVKSSNWQPALVKKMRHSVLKKLELTKEQEDAFLKRELTHESQL